MGARVDLSQLKYFQLVAELGSFSRAASRLGMTQPGISRQVQKIEAELRSQLFYRNGRGVILTEAGERLLASVQPILQQLDEVKMELIERASGPAGLVTLGIPPSFGDTVGVKVIHRFRAQFPGATLRLHESISATLLEIIDSGQIDVAVLYSSRLSLHLDATPLFDAHLFLVWAANEATAPEEDVTEDVSILRNLPLILPGPSSGLRRAIDAAAEATKTPLSIAMEVHSTNILKQLVADGIGYTVLPYGLIHREVATKQLRCARLNPDEATVRLMTTFSRHRPTTSAVRSMVQLLREAVADCVIQGLLRGAHPGK